MLEMEMCEELEIYRATELVSGSLIFLQFQSRVISSISFINSDFRAFHFLTRNYEMVLVGAD